ncbi:HAD-like domain-containing protein [Apiosordaria backusii]|uniref:HAD-like domain-containing protein n=1 Tax=Apiosordaria backusii TaxID=314023 RepID=A0AA40B2T2_9PEZI|nr:HAD-like domain-containing protein [Apiosordaria backusii]
MTTPNYPPPNAGSPPKLIIFDFDGTLFDFDGTLFDTHTSITHYISLTFSHLLPSSQPPTLPSTRATISSGAGLEPTFRTLLLHVPTQNNPTDINNLDLANWITTYRTLYASEGQSLIKPFAKVDCILRELKAIGIPVVVISNKGKEAVEQVLEKEGLAKLVALVVGDTPGVPKKPDPASFRDLVSPLYPDIKAKDILVVGDTEADILFAKNIGAHSCWASYGYGEPEKCENLAYDVKINELSNRLPSFQSVYSISSKGLLNKL